MLLVMQGEQTNSVLKWTLYPARKDELLCFLSQAKPRPALAIVTSSVIVTSAAKCWDLSRPYICTLNFFFFLHEIFVSSVAKTTYRAQSNSTPHRHKLAVVSIFCIDIVLFSKEMYLWSIQQTGNLELGSFDEKKVQGLTRTVTNFQDITGLSKPVRIVHTKQCEENDLNSTS